MNSLTTSSPALGLTTVRVVPSGAMQLAEEAHASLASPGVPKSLPPSAVVASHQAASSSLAAESGTSLPSSVRAFPEAPSDCLCAASACGVDAPCNPANGACECTSTSCLGGQTCDAATKQCVTVDPTLCTDPGTGEQRAMVAPLVGDLVLSESLADPSAVADAAGEWIEIFVKADVDLNGVELAVAANKTALAPGPACVRPGAGAYVLVARNGDPATNGGLPPILATTTAASKQLSGDKLDVSLNDAAANWCNTPTGTTYGAGDRGTPGQANAACP